MPTALRWGLALVRLTVPLLATFVVLLIACEHYPIDFVGAAVIGFVVSYGVTVVTNKSIPLPASQEPRPSVDQQE